jgi:predicted dehydrogenase
MAGTPHRGLRTKHWGTGETLNNGTHEIDVCRWALNANFPNSVEATGGRYAYKDDWQFYDTLSVSWKYDDKLITWDCLCCNHMKRYGRDRGSLIVGTKGSVIVDGDGYEVFDPSGKQIDAYLPKKEKSTSSDTTGVDSMTDLHFGNFIAGTQSGTKLDQPVESGNVTVRCCNLPTTRGRRNAS